MYNTPAEVAGMIHEPFGRRELQRGQKDIPGGTDTRPCIDEVMNILEEQRFLNIC